ncbi:MAG: hypothetical protein NTW50_05140, partial [Candidatus Berkelbacteria bacterium]|nr:hypothetical protein [Candidatus Berkelbacteria bacterium]
DILRDDIEKMAQSWKEVVNNISSKIETFRDRFYRVGRMEPKRMQRYFLQILEGQDVNDRMIHSLIKERIITELKPKALRIVLLIDNSGSMSDSGKVDSIKKSVLLLNSSLRSFRAIFKLMMEDVYSEYGMTLPENIDIVTDIQIRLFGEEASMVKPFEVNDYSFLTEPEGTVALPQIDPDRETIATVIAFQNIRPNGGTDDTSSYEEIVGNDLNEKIVGHILKGEISEAIIQISDGGVNMAGHSMAKNKAGERSRTIYSGATGENLSTNGDRRTIQLIKFLREKYKVGTAGFAIGAGGEAETAYKALVERMGSSDYVTSANNISEIVQGFSAIIRNVIVQQVQNKMIDELEGYAQRIEAEIKQTPED